jgi:hypothetical protein
VHFFFDHYGVLIEIFSNQNTLKAKINTALLAYKYKEKVEQLEQGLIGKIKEFLCV